MWTCTLQGYFISLIAFSVQIERAFKFKQFWGDTLKNYTVVIVDFFKVKSFKDILLSWLTVQFIITESSRGLGLVACFGSGQKWTICRVWQLGSFPKVFLTSLSSLCRLKSNYYDQGNFWYLSSLFIITCCTSKHQLDLALCSIGKWLISLMNVHYHKHHQKYRFFISTLIFLNFPTSFKIHSEKERGKKWKERATF
jgi:hypothetical protein